MEHALVVDDHRAIARQIGEILKSMGHTCEIAYDQAEALQAFEKSRFTYCVTDLNIPVSKNGLARIENGLNLITQLLERRSSPDVFVIAVTSHARDGGHNLAVKAMKLGAADYVCKHEMVSGDRALDRVVAEAIAGRSPSKPRSNKRPEAVDAPADFAGGELVITEDGVTLCGRNIVADTFGESPRVLKVLAQRGDEGVSLRRSDKVIADELGIDPSSVRSCIATLRKNCTRRLNDLFVVGTEDVIASDRGYFLRDWITVRVEAPARKKVRS